MGGKLVAGKRWMNSRKFIRLRYARSCKIQSHEIIEHREIPGGVRERQQIEPIVKIRATQ
jgi:hypothetical protein